MKNKVFISLIILIAAFALSGCVSEGAVPVSEHGEGIILKGKDATIHNDLETPMLKVEEPKGNLGYWHHIEDYVTWDVEIPAAGDYIIAVNYAAWAENAGSSFTIEIGGQTLNGVFISTSPRSDGFFEFKEMDVGTVSLKAGAQVLTMKVTELTNIAAGNILEVILYAAE